MRAAVFVAVSVGITALVVAWFLVTSRRLKDVLESDPDGHPDTPAERFYGPHPSAPAGPDAESQRPEDTGNAWDPPPPPLPRRCAGDGRRPDGPDGRRADHPPDRSDLAHGDGAEHAGLSRGLIAVHTAPYPNRRRRRPAAPGVAITTHTIGHQVVVHPCGELDVDTDPLLRRRLAEVVEIGALDVVVDLSEVRFLGVGAVRVLLDAHQWLVDRGGRLRLSSPSRPARRLFDLTGAAAVLDTNARS